MSCSPAHATAIRGAASNSPACVARGDLFRGCCTPAPIRTRRRPRRAALPVVHHAQLRVDLTNSPGGDGVCVPHRRQYLCCRRPLRSGALLPLPVVSFDEHDQNRAVAGEPSPTRPILPPLDVAIAGSCQSRLAHLLLIAPIGYSQLPFVDSSR
jgi:hypothetical protein